MKTKEQLSDEKLFADFIELYVEIGNYVDDNYWYYRSEISKNGWREFNPLEDWNLLHKAFDKCFKITIKQYPSNYSVTRICDNITTCVTNSYNEGAYKYILEFIKLYNKINTNTNNNQP